MQDIHIDAADQTPRSIVAIGRDYPSGFLVAPHHHRRGQLISGASGLIVLTTTGGTWVMPPQRGMWIPPGTQHHVRMVGAVSMQSLYVKPNAVPGMARECQVVSISPFLRGLVTEALDLPLEYDHDGRAGALMALILHEILRLPALPLSLQYPAHTLLAERCRQFVERPNIRDTIDEWATALHMSRRSFTRLFRHETGVSFVAWRQQACLLSAMPRLAAGEPVTNVAIDLGYENPASFTLMFKRAFGRSPLAYLRLQNSERLYQRDAH